MRKKRRIWLVGSGPSLRDTDMDLLHWCGETSMAMNKIGRVRRDLGWEWKPSIYFKVDYNSVDVGEWKEEIEYAASWGIPMFLWEMFRTGYPPDHPNYHDMPSGVGRCRGRCGYRAAASTTTTWPRTTSRCRSGICQRSAPG